jgi:hypothetical protein
MTSVTAARLSGENPVFLNRTHTGSAPLINDWGTNEPGGIQTNLPSVIGILCKTGGLGKEENRVKTAPRMGSAIWGTRLGQIRLVNRFWNEPFLSDRFARIVEGKPSYRDSAAG